MNWLFVKWGGVARDEEASDSSATELLVAAHNSYFPIFCSKNAADIMEN